jgi:uncharacterized repeat protein (TIGR01451 family)
MSDRLRVVCRWGVLLSVALAVALGSFTAWGDEECTKRPDLWLPPDGTPGLADGGISVQETSGDVCEGGTVTVTVTIDNLSCGDAGPFDVTLYYDDPSHVIGTQPVDGLLGCEYIVLTFEWDTDGAPTGSHEILACADTGGTVIELNEGNNCLTVDTDLLVSPNAPWIEADKLLEDLNGYTIEPGETVRYEIVIRNDGCADQEDNPGHEFVDALPEGITPLGSVTATRGTADVVGGEIVWDGSIPAGGSVTIVYEAKIDATVEIGTQLCNQGTVFWDSDGDGENDAAEPTDNPGTPIDDDPTCTTIEHGGGAAPLTGTIDAPTLSQWGAIAAFALFGVSFGFVLRRRRRAATG